MVYAAIDIHKRIFQAAVLEAETGELRQERLPATREALNDWASRWQGKLEAVALEATTGWRWVARELQARGLDVPYVQPPTGPGVFEPVAPTQPVTPGLGLVRPFTYDSPSDYRPRGPVDLASGRYAQDVTDVQHTAASTAPCERRRRPRASASTPSRRSSSSTAPCVSWRTTAASTCASLRLLGYVNVATADTMIACWDAKYHYDFWRPTHAIQRADTDGNPGTSLETGWLPLIVVNHPEYPSGHSCFTGAVTESLRNYFGTKHVRLVASSTAPGTGPPRTYENLDELVNDVENARVWAGLHDRSTMTKSAKHFPLIARDVGRKHFLVDAGPGNGEKH
jgi:hypothetical protein